mgnify:CR=1 FL=1|tara:strand:- start:146 stop:433 length:288 start_codon:yes stop_codon:yes gene_type:complete
MLSNNLNMLVPYYLMSCYLYYECDKNVLSDTQFDNLCKRLLDNWDSINHVHKHLIDKDALKCGSGYDIQYTNLIKRSAIDWYETMTTKQLEKENV